MTNESLFSGLRVLDIASFIAGPAATTVSSDFGADVIKVERPGMGDPHRYTYLSPLNTASTENCPWQLDNRFRECPVRRPSAANRASALFGIAISPPESPHTAADTNNSDDLHRSGFLEQHRRQRQRFNNSQRLSPSEEPWIALFRKPARRHGHFLK